MSGRHRVAALALPLCSLSAFAAVAWRADVRPARAAAPGALAPEEQAAVVETLQTYTRIYEDFFASGGVPAMLNEFPASKSVKHHVFRDIGFLQQAGLVLVQDHASSVLVRLTRTGADTAEAVVHEEWNHLYQHAQDRTHASEMKGLGQAFRYVLRRENGRWVVVAWDVAPDARPPEEASVRW